MDEEPQENAHDVSKTLAEMSVEATAALEKFHSLGLKINGSSRVPHYVRTLKQFSGMDSRAISKKGATALVGMTMMEVADFIEIAALPERYLATQCVIDRLQIALHGKVFRHEYGARDHDPNRDATFELSTAAYLHRNGVLGSPPTDLADVEFRDGGCVLPIECKRLTSPKRLTDNIRYAREQLQTRVRNGAAAGIVAIDLTRALNPDATIFYYPSVESLRAGCGKKMHTFIGENLLDIQTQSSRYEEVLGVAFRLTIPGYTSTAANARRFIEWSFVQTREDDIGQELFRMCIEKFGSQIPLMEVKREPTHLPYIIGQLIG